MTNNMKIWISNIKTVTNQSLPLIVSIFSFLFGIISITWTPYELALRERLQMRPGFPPLEWWKIPPEARLSIYIYNITNAERFSSGQDPKLLMEEIGPIHFSEVWKHQDIVFNENDTMTYVANRTVKYKHEDNFIDLNATIIVPNLAVLLAVSHFWNESIFLKFGLNSLFNLLGSKPIINITIHDFLFKNTDRFLDMAYELAPFLTPERNLGIIHMLYKDFSDTVTAFVGAKNGDQLFSLIDKYHGSDNIPGQGDTCKSKITNASEGITYHQMITPDTVIKYYRKFLCKVMHLYYEEEQTVFGVTAYKFSVAKDELNRIYPPEADCYNTYPSLPNGVSDVSKCFYSFPLTISYVYFNFTDNRLKTCAEIIKPPNKTVPLPHIYVEPITGIPLKSSATIQANLNIKPLRGFNEVLDKFSDSILPLFWLRYYHEELPLKILLLIYFVLALPVIGWIITISLFLLGIYSIWKYVRRRSTGKKKDFIEEELKKSSLELEAFIPIPS